MALGIMAIITALICWQRARQLADSGRGAGVWVLVTGVLFADALFCFALNMALFKAICVWLAAVSLLGGLSVFLLGSFTTKHDKQSKQ